MTSAEIDAAMDELPVNFDFRAEMAWDRLHDLQPSRTVRRHRCPAGTVGWALWHLGEVVDNMFVDRPFNPFCVGGPGDVITEIDPYAVRLAEVAVNEAIRLIDSALVAGQTLRPRPSRSQRRAAQRRRHSRLRGASNIPYHRHGDHGPPGGVIASSPHLTNAPPSQFTASPEWAQVGRLSA